MRRGLGALGQDASVFDLEYGERIVNNVEANGAIDETDPEEYQEDIKNTVLGLVPNRKPIGLMTEAKPKPKMPSVRSSAGKRMNIKDLM